MKQILICAAFLSALFVACTNPCADVNCLNGGECNEGSCVCPTGFGGEYCEETLGPCANVSCLNGGVCVDGSCDCPEGYTGENCEVEVPNTCAGVNCGLHGVCVDGDCVCEQGYEGEFCAELSRDKFIGSYTANEQCSIGNYTYTVNISASSVNVYTVTIDNLYDAGQVISATVDGNELTIPSQTIGGTTYSGSGVMAGPNTLTITFTITVGSDSDTCSVVCVS